jgi:hypothetical protein
MEATLGGVVACRRGIFSDLRRRPSQSCALIVPLVWLPDHDVDRSKQIRQTVLFPKLSRWCFRLKLLLEQGSGSGAVTCQHLIGSSAPELEGTWKQGAQFCPSTDGHQAPPAMIGE